MCIVLDVKCPKAKSKSKTSNKKTSKKHNCHECAARKAAKEEVNCIFPSVASNHVVSTMNPHLYQPAHKAIYDWEGGSAWEDNYPAMISKKQWRTYTKMNNNAYSLSHENGTKIVEAKNAIVDEVREAQKAIKNTYAGVNKTEARVKETREAIDLANVGIRNTHFAVNEAHVAIKKTQDAIHDNHAEYMSKQVECAADVARVRQLLEEEAKQREETRRVQEMVRYAQSQGLLHTPAQALALAQAQAQMGSRSSSPDTLTSLSSSGTRRLSRRSRADGEHEAQKRRQLEREREREREKSDQHPRAQYSEAMRGIADTRQRLQEEQERWSRAEWELEWLRRRDSYFHSPRLPGGYYDDVVDAPLYDTDSFVEHGGGGGVGHLKDRGRRTPRRVQPKCRQWGNM